MSCSRATRRRTQPLPNMAVLTNANPPSSACAVAFYMTPLVLPSPFASFRADSLQTLTFSVDAHGVPGPPTDGGGKPFQLVPFGPTDGGSNACAPVYIPGGATLSVGYGSSVAVGFGQSVSNLGGRARINGTVTSLLITTTTTSEPASLPSCASPAFSLAYHFGPTSFGHPPPGVPGVSYDGNVSISGLSGTLSNFIDYRLPPYTTASGVLAPATYYSGVDTAVLTYTGTDASGRGAWSGYSVGPVTAAVCGGNHFVTVLVATGTNGWGGVVISSNSPCETSFAIESPAWNTSTTACW